MNVATFILAIAAGAAASQGGMLVEKGSARCSVVIPDDATPTVQHASAELVSYLKRISGAEVPVTGEKQSGGQTRIDVGLTRRARERLPEGFLEEDSRRVVRPGTCGADNWLRRGRQPDLDCQYSLSSTVRNQGTMILKLG